MFALQTICEKTLWQRKEMFTLIDYGVQFVHKIIEEKSEAIVREEV